MTNVIISKAATKAFFLLMITVLATGCGIFEKVSRNDSPTEREQPTEQEQPQKQTKLGDCAEQALGNYEATPELYLEAGTEIFSCGFNKEEFLNRLKKWEK